MNTQPQSITDLIERSKQTVLTSPTQYTLNIGLMASTKFDLLAQSRVFDADIYASTSWATHAKDLLAYHVARNIVYKLERELNLPCVKLWRVARSNTEPTLVATFDLADGVHCISKMRSKLKYLADYYAQECIAVRQDSSDQGFLIGRYADDWGSFNPTWFIS